jgi:hemolysin activation/secretion protein
LLEADAEAWMPVDMPFLNGEQKLSARLAGQWANTLLPAPWRFALGGASRARAFDRSSFLADRGIVFSLEARAPLPLGEFLVFTDWGYGDDRAADDHRWRRLGDVGIGWEATLAEGLVSRVSWAEPVATTGSGDWDGNGSRVYWSLRYAY